MACALEELCCESTSVPLAEHTNVYTRVDGSRNTRRSFLHALSVFAVGKMFRHGMNAALAIHPTVIGASPHLLGACHAIARLVDHLCRVPLYCCQTCLAHFLLSSTHNGSSD